MIFDKSSEQESPPAGNLTTRTARTVTCPDGTPVLAGGTPLEGVWDQRLGYPLERTWTQSPGKGLGT